MLRLTPINQHERELASIAPQAALGRDAVFRETRNARSILTTGVLFYSIPGDPGVFFTRSPETAVYWIATRAGGALLIFDLNRSDVDTGPSLQDIEDPSKSRNNYKQSVPPCVTFVHE
jgi:hypothetical protein